jgi:hypothetical protein
MVSAVGTAAIDDSTDRSTSIERGPAVDLMVDGGEPADLLEERAADPAVAGTG